MSYSTSAAQTKLPHYLFKVSPSSHLLLTHSISSQSMICQILGYRMSSYQYVVLQHVFTEES